MEPAFIRPDSRYLAKSYIEFILLGIVITGPCMLLGYFIGNDNGGAASALLGLLIALGANLLWFVPGIFLLYPYYRSLQYEIYPDEVIVRAGIITKSVKHVPYRTVTNIETKRGPFDRLFGLGSLNIQTAGASGDSGPEEKLVGLPDVEAVYNRIAGVLRQFRGSMSPVQTSDDHPANGSDPALVAILDEVRAIRESLQR